MPTKGKKLPAGERTSRVRALFQRLELIVEQYHALWQDQPEIHYPNGLVIATLRALIVDEEEGGGGLPQSAIVTRLNRSPVLVTRMMQELEAAGLVERSLGKFDQRQRAVKITPRGRSHLGAFEDLKASIGDDIFSLGTPESWEELTHRLDHIIAVLKDVGEERMGKLGPSPSSAGRDPA